MRHRKSTLSRACLRASTALPTRMAVAAETGEVPAQGPVKEQGEEAGEGRP